MHIYPLLYVEILYIMLVNIAFVFHSLHDTTQQMCVVRDIGLEQFCYKMCHTKHLVFSIQPRNSPVYDPIHHCSDLIDSNLSLVTPPDISLLSTLYSLLSKSPQECHSVCTIGLPCSGRYSFSSGKHPHLFKQACMHTISLVYSAKV